MMKTTRHTVSAVVLPILTVTWVINLAGCGTILYPERNGQHAGSIDPLVAVLDGVGLLFFLIPGVIAFAVDFNNHSIYLPHGQHSRLTGKLDKDSIEQFVLERTGTRVDLRQANLEVIRLDSLADLDAQFAAHDPGVRVASIR